VIKRSLLLAGAILGSMCICAPAGAEPIKPGVNLHVGTDGYGIGGEFGITDHLAGRIDLNSLDFNRGFNSASNPYRGQINFKTVGVNVDWRPFENGFIVTAGILAGSRTIDGSYKPTGNVTIGSGNYPAAAVGTMKARATFQNIVPTLGVAGEISGPWGLKLRGDLGASAGSGPRVTLTDSAGGVSAADLKKEARTAESKLKPLAFYPTIAFRITKPF
jgi:hypothetical protein